MLSAYQPLSAVQLVVQKPNSGEEQLEDVLSAFQVAILVGR
jgi:exonuclease VII small subunit